MIFKTIDDETTLSGQRIVGALQARKIAQEQAIKQTNTDIQCLKNYEVACKNGTVTSDDFTRIMGKASTQAQEYSKNIKDGTGSAQIYADKQKTLQKSIQNTGTASKVAAVGVKALSIAGNMLAGMAISFAISKVIEGIEYLATASERAIEKTKELQQEISQISSDYQSERQTLEGLREEYDALTSKIGENGAEASLSADEYERYRDITSEILGITPKLITGWDDEGRAISNKNGLLQQSINLLDEEYQKSLRNSTTRPKLEEIASGIIAQKEEHDNDPYTKTFNDTTDALINGFINDLKQIESEGKADEYKLVETMWQYLDPEDYAKNYDNFWYDGIDTYEQLRDLIDKVGYDAFAESFSNEDNPIYQYFSSEQVNELIDRASEYKQQVELIEDEEEQIYQQYKDTLYDCAKSVGDGYDTLDESTKSGITQMIDSFDYSDMTEKKFADMGTDLKDFVDKLSTDDTLRSYFNNLFTPMGEDESIEDYETRVKTGIDEITSYCESNYPAIKLSFGDVESDVEELKEKYNTAISKFVGDANDVDLAKFFEDNSINDESEIDYWNSVTEGAKSATEAVEMYNTAKEKDNEIDVFDPTTSLANAKDAFSGFESIYDDIHNGTSVAVDSIESLNEAFGSLDGGTALQEFKDVLTTMPDDIDAQQKALNKLATEYLDNSDLIQNLTEDNAEYVESELRKMGVINADTVVSSRLASKMDYLSQAEQEYSNLMAYSASNINGAAEAKRYAELSSIDLTNATLNQIGALIDEANATGQASAYLVAYAKQLISAGRVAITTDGSIKNLVALVKQLDDTSKIADLYAQMQAAMSRGDTTTANALRRQIEAEAKKVVRNVGNNANTVIQYAPPSAPSTSDGGGSGSGSSSKSETSETFDHIETKINRLEETISRLDKTANNTYDNWTNRNTALSQEMSKVREEINLQQQAYNRYMQEANKVGLSADYVDKIKNGKLDIETIKDQDLLDKINSFKEWFDKATACSDAIQDLNINLSELAELQFDNISQEYSDLISLIESKADIIDERINRTEEQGYFASASYYKQQLQYESQEMDKLSKQYAELVAQRDSAVLNGYIKEGSEAYNDMTKAILDVQQAMEESATATVELNNAIRDLNWEIFDYIEERISKITDESNFLIDLLDNQSLYNDNGSFNDRGQSAVYLHGQNVKVYTQQAKDYANELKKINKDLAKDPSNKDLIERREELLDLQQESISNIYAEKEAVKSLVEEGIAKHLESLSELIDKYKNAMNSAKD